MRALLLTILLSSVTVFADTGKEDVDAYLVEQEEILAEALNTLRSAEDDATRKEANDNFRNLLAEVLPYPGVMDYPFEKLASMSTIKSPDGEFRLFNWNVEDDNLVHAHYCFVVRPGRIGKDNTVIELIEDKITLPPRPDGILTPKSWYGALYYNIIPVKKGSHTLYTMIGFNGNDRSTNRKLLDVFYFKGKNMRMGYPLFQESAGSGVLLKRVFLDYSEKASVSLNMNHNLAAIVFDHLVPEQANLEGVYDYYIPDMTYDGYEWKDGMWKYKEDIIAYNDPNRKVKHYVPGDEEKNDTYTEVKDVWVDPVDPATPVNNGGVDAKAPIEQVDPKQKQQDASSSTEKTKKKFRLFKWRSTTHSAIGDDKAERKQNRSNKKLK